MEKLNEQWKTIIIGTEKFSARCYEEDETFKISITNLREIWTEDLHKNQIIQRCQVNMKSTGNENLFFALHDSNYWKKRNVAQNCYEIAAS